jgi:hypothetical protein
MSWSAMANRGDIRAGRQIANGKVWEIMDVFFGGKRRNMGP